MLVCSSCLCFRKEEAPNIVVSIFKVSNEQTTEMGLGDSHINALDTVLATLADNKRERKALFQTAINEHGLSLIRTGVFCFHFHPGTSVEAKQDDESCQDERSKGGTRSDRHQHIENRGRSVTKISNMSYMSIVFGRRDENG